MAEMGRPEIQIDWIEFGKLAAMFATKKEIADWFGCSEDTIERAVKRAHDMTFAVYYARAAAKGKISLRRAQVKNAIDKGNVQMQIWLGKQYLGQSEQAQPTETPDPPLSEEEKLT